MVGGGVNYPPTTQTKTRTIIANYWKSYDTVGSRPFIMELYVCKRNRDQSDAKREGNGGIVHTAQRSTRGEESESKGGGSIT